MFSKDSAPSPLKAAEPKSLKDAVAYRLNSRGVIQVCGRDTVDLLQGLITSDVTELTQTKAAAAQYSMMLNVQGRVLYDLILYNKSKLMESCFLIECDDTLKEDFMKTIKRYRIRKKMDIADVSSEYQVWSIVGDLDPTKPLTLSPEVGGKTVDLPNAVFCLPDPRVPHFGYRVIFRDGEESLTCSNRGDKYRELRYRWGIPEGPMDLPPGNCLPLESNLAYMNGVSFVKGCYIGQELTARTHHTGVIRKRIVPLVFDSPPPVMATDTQINTEKGKTAGKLRGTVVKYGLGLLRMQHLGEPLTVDLSDGREIRLSCVQPGWWPTEQSS